MAPAAWSPEPERPKYAATSVLPAGEPDSNFASTAIDNPAISFGDTPSSGPGAAAPGHAPPSAAPNTWNLSPGPANVASPVANPADVASPSPAPAPGAQALPPAPQSDTVLKLALAGLVVLIVIIASIILIGVALQISGEESASDEHAEQLD